MIKSVIKPEQMNKTALLDCLADVVTNPQKQLATYLAQGKKVIGCLPVYCPEEIVEAAGMVPFGIWGTETEVAEAKRYFPAFICSILQTSLELGIKGVFDDLSAVMIPVLCDSLKCMGQNWKMAVKQVPFIPVIHPQNRKMEAGIVFLTKQYAKIKKQCETISGETITDQQLQEAIDLYNCHRQVMREFSDLVGRYPQLLTAKQRSHVIKSAYFMTKTEHLALVQALIQRLNEEVESQSLAGDAFTGVRVVTTGIIVDSPKLLDIFEANQIKIVADEVAHESRQFRTDVPADSNPLRAMARLMAEMEGCSVLYDPEKKRADMIVDMVKDYQADGVVVVMTKFCDPEEYDYALLKKKFDASGIPSVIIEVDQQMQNYGQAETILQTFSEMVNL